MRGALGGEVWNGRWNQPVTLGMQSSEPKKAFPAGNRDLGLTRAGQTLSEPPLPSSVQESSWGPPGDPC